MNPQKLIASILLTLAIGFVGACRKNQTPSAAKPAGTVPASPSPEASRLPEGGTTPAGQTTHFKGSIGNTNGLQMKLARDGEKLTGTYFYQKIGTKIDLKGTIDKDGNVTLEEFDTGGKQTGVFKGTWKTDSEDGLVSIAGNWSKPAGEKKTPFSLHEEPMEFSGAVELAGKQIKETNKKLNYEIQAEYPQATGAADTRFDKFNLEAKSLVTKRIGEFRKDMADEAKEAPKDETGNQENQSPSPGNYLEISYDIATAKDDLISIKFEFGSYYRTAAHPNSNSAVLNYDVKANKVLKLSDLFKPGAKYLQAISAYCIKDLKKQSKSKDSTLPADMIQSGAGADAKNFKSWTITKTGLEITFDAYQVGPYVAGPQSVLVSYSALKDLIKPAGPLGSFAK